MLLGHATDMCSEQVAFFFSLPKSPDELQGGVGRTSSCMRLCSTRSYDAVYLDVHFISSLPVMQRTVCKAWADTRPVQIAWAES